MKLKLLLITTFTSLILSTQLLANGLSLGLLVGQSSDEFTAQSCEFDRQYFTVMTGGQPFSCTVDDTDTAVGINLSYHFTDMWGLELGYLDLGQTSQFLTGPGTGVFSTSGTNESIPETIDVTAGYFVGTVTFGFAERWSVTGRLGAASVESKLVSSLFELESKEDESTTIGGISLNYQFTDAWGANIRYDYFDLDFSIDVTSLGVIYTF